MAGGGGDAGDYGAVIKIKGGAAQQVGKHTCPLATACENPHPPATACSQALTLLQPATVLTAHWPTTCYGPLQY